MQTLVQLLPHAECGLLKSMFIYQPTSNSLDRVAWYGGESTTLHYQIMQDYFNSSIEWIDEDARTLGNGIPSGMSELHAELVNFYNDCQ